MLILHHARHNTSALIGFGFVQDLLFILFVCSFVIEIVARNRLSVSGECKWDEMFSYFDIKTLFFFGARRVCVLSWNVNHVATKWQLRAMRTRYKHTRTHPHIASFVLHQLPRMFYMNVKNIHGVDYLFIQFLLTPGMKSANEQKKERHCVVKKKRNSESCYRFNLYRKYVR